MGDKEWRWFTSALTRMMTMTVFLFMVGFLQENFLFSDLTDIRSGVKLAWYANICSLTPPPTLSIQNVSLSSIVSLVHCCNWLRKDWIHLHNVSGINYLLDNCSLSEGFSKQSVSVICRPNSLWVTKLWFSSIARQNFSLLSGCWTRAACDWMIFRERL